MRKHPALFCAVFLLFSSICRAEGLGTLMDIAQSQDLIKRQYEQETRAFEKVKNAIERGDIKKGQAKDYILSKYGRPVVAVKDLDGKREDLIYKPASSSFFDGVRATLIFTEEGVLDDTRIEDVR